MTPEFDPDAAGSKGSRRLFIYNGGFLTQPRIRRILELSGWKIRVGKPGPEDWIGVWGKSPTSPRGETVAEHTGQPVLRVEDAFLRSVKTGRDGDPPIGLTLDSRAVHFDSSMPSDLEILLATHPLDDTALLNRARDATARLHRAHLSKYSAFDPNAKIPKAPYVVVIDQTKGDASIEYGGANAATFREMLVFAQTENPGSRVIIKAHPETISGHREGHFGPQDAQGRVAFLDQPVSPLALFEGATAVYTVSSQLGFEAILAGHKPRVFGQPFYSGWGLTNDENPVARRERKLTRAQLFAAAMILYPVWYDPYRDQICELEDAIGALEAQARAWREDRTGYLAIGMRMWKRGHLRQFFGKYDKIKFASTATDKSPARRKIIWGVPDENAASDSLIIEDGFLRSKGLGANLIAPLSLVVDDLGIYYDPRSESRLEKLIAASTSLPAGAVLRAQNLIRTLNRSGVSKYNVGQGELPHLPVGHRILVAGQVEDDASVLYGCADISTNAALLEFARHSNPDAIIVYKPHPDVEAGLRIGALSDTEALKFADIVASDADPISLINAVDEVWSMTSLIGFEALIRRKSVTCVGTPFYAGWGLTTDLGKVPVRRSASPTLAQLVHAVLIDYPRYHDPVTNLPCPVEVAVERLAQAGAVRSTPLNRVLSKLQGLFASYSQLWR